MKHLFHALMLLAVLGAAEMAAAQEVTIDPIRIADPGPAAELIAGDTATGGTGCYNWDDSPTVITGDRILLPVRTFVKRDSGSALKRGSCQWALPLQVPAGRKLVIHRIDLENLINLPAGASSKAQIEVFAAGAQGPKIELSGEASADHGLRVLHGGGAEIGFVSRCGEALTLRANSSVLVNGGDGRASSKLDRIVLSYELADCATAEAPQDGAVIVAQ